MSINVTRTLALQFYYTFEVQYTHSVQEGELLLLTTRECPVRQLRHVAEGIHVLGNRELHTEDGLASRFVPTREGSPIRGCQKQRVEAMSDEIIALTFSGKKC